MHFINCAVAFCTSVYSHAFNNVVGTGVSWAQFCVEGSCAKFYFSIVKSFVLLVIGSYLSDHYLFLAVRF